MASVALWLVVAVITLVAYAVRKIFNIFGSDWRRRVALIEQLPGPPALPLIGNAHQFDMEHIRKSTHSQGLQGAPTWECRLFVPNRPNVSVVRRHIPILDWRQSVCAHHGARVGRADPVE